MHKIARTARNRHEEAMAMRKILAGILVGSGIALAASTAFASTERESETSDRAVPTVQGVQPETQLTAPSTAAEVVYNGGHDRQ